jgi:GMP synthase-like glutamine amidotransferase
VRALVVEHERATPGGYVMQWLVDREFETEVLQIDVEAQERDPTAYDLIVALGSEFPAYDDSIPWLGREKRLLGGAVDAGVPVLGVCFGGQLLARLLGGEVWRAGRSEIGWLPVSSSEADLVSPGPWFQWHFDTFSLPPGARLVADSPVGPQAYIAGRSLGVQFHPEVTPEIMEEWVRVYRHELDADGVDPDALLQETLDRAPASRRAAYQLLDGFAERVAYGGGEALVHRERVRGH